MSSHPKNDLTPLVKNSHWSSLRCKYKNTHRHTHIFLRMNFSTFQTAHSHRNTCVHKEIEEVLWVILCTCSFLRTWTKLWTQQWHLAMKHLIRTQALLPLLFGSRRDIVLLSLTLHEKSKCNSVLYGRCPRPLSTQRINLEAYQLRWPFSPRACPINWVRSTVRVTLK